ncbi:cDP-alcohol phosphatidyltransferase [Clostridium sp. CAG:768]|jgi:CDP-diacylglycerol---glycerol-3-phosphate 3-phosphatidyltransferase|uniref:CDP-alcohol phosphatidyltransferase family protein n=1 Tax=Candidatus Stercorousia sp. TaxID=3048886 RepID=UPI00033FD7E2|nr:cDP-alcohol phosphatidyltransferase [Clostridium sp. CAG:768]
MNIKNNIANIVSVSRIFVAYAAIALLYEKTTWSYILAFILTIIAFSMDGLDGYLARKLNQSSEWGSVLDILGDRIVEVSYWTVFAVMGWINILFPLVCVARAFTTDGIRSVALSKGMTAFGEKSMQSTSWGKFICASRFMRISYAVAKVLAFLLLIAVNTPGMEFWKGTPTLHIITMIFAWAAIIFCVVRAIPVVAESGKLFNDDKQN